MGRSNPQQGGAPAVPAESVLPGPRRRPVIGRAESVGHVPGAAHLGSRVVVETVLDVRRRSRPARAACATGSTRPVRFGTAGPTGSAGTAGATRSAGATRLVSSTPSPQPRGA